LTLIYLVLKNAGLSVTRPTSLLDILNGNQFDPLVLFLLVNQMVYKSLTNN